MGRTNKQERESLIPPDQQMQKWLIGAKTKHVIFNGNVGKVLFISGSDPENTCEDPKIFSEVRKLINNDQLSEKKVKYNEYY